MFNVFCIRKFFSPIGDFFEPDTKISRKKKSKNNQRFRKRIKSRKNNDIREIKKEQDDVFLIETSARLCDYGVTKHFRSSFFLEIIETKKSFEIQKLIICKKYTPY